MSVPKRLRYEVLRRDAHSCRYCGAQAPDVPLTVDHVIPTALGGSDDPENLVTACKDCNAGKAASSPDAPIVDNVADDALRWSRAMARAAEIQAGERARLFAFVNEVDTAWCNWTMPVSRWDAEANRVVHERAPMWRPDDWRATIEKFAQLSLEASFIADAIDRSMNARNVSNGNSWRYMCGICWRTIRERQAVARAMLDAEAGA